MESIRSYGEGAGNRHPEGGWTYYAEVPEQPAGNGVQDVSEELTAPGGELLDDRLYPPTENPEWGPNRSRNNPGVGDIGADPTDVDLDDTDMGIDPAYMGTDPAVTARRSRISELVARAMDRLSVRPEANKRQTGTEAIAEQYDTDPTEQQ